MLSFQVRLVLNPEVETLRLVKVWHTRPQLFAVPRDCNRAMEEQMAKKLAQILPLLGTVLSARNNNVALGSQIQP